MKIKKKYVLKKEIKEELLNLTLEVLGLVTISGIVILLILLNGLMF